VDLEDEGVAADGAWQQDDATVARLGRLLRWWPDAPLTAVAVLVVALLHAGGSGAGVVLDAAAAIVLVPLVLVDLRARRLPDPLTLGGAGALVVTLAVSGAWSGDFAPWWRGLAGAGLLAGVLLVLHLVSPSGMGFGDVKLGLLLGVLVGSRGLGLVLTTLLVAGLAGSLVGLTLAVATRRRHVTLPFGPCLVLGAVISLALSTAGPA
jgi:leader peptidase (prepilin peptidase)/N-methyltransferase